MLKPLDSCHVSWLDLIQPPQPVPTSPTIQQKDKEGLHDIERTLAGSWTSTAKN